MSLVRKTIFSALVLVGTSSCNDDVRVTSGSSDDLSKPSTDIPVWQDEFTTGEQPDPSKWNFDIGSKLLGGTVWGNSEREYYTDDRKNAFINNGVLTIQAVHELHQDAPSGYEIVATSARITSNTAGYFAAIGDKPYGFYEFRARLSCVAGAWPALWLLGKDGDWPAGGEIDVLEWSGRSNNKTSAMSAFHTSATVAGDVRDNSKTQTVSDLCGEYHLYQLDWTENAIVMGIDGVATLRFDRKPSYTAYEWPFDKPAFLLMNVAVGGTLGGDVNTANIQDMKLEIDYVRVWKY